jgi:penicillin-binding protein 1A
MVRQYMIQAYNEKTYADGFNVYTTISAKNQVAADKALHKGLLAYERRHGYRGPAGRENINSETDKGRLDDILKDYPASGELLPAVVVKVEDKSARVYTQNGNTLTINWPGLTWAQAYIDENTLGPVPKKAADVVRVGDVIYIENVQGDDWALAQPPRVAGGLVSLRPSDGAILALSGGFDFYESSFNRIIQAERQPGSSLKPFVYSAALEKGFTAASLISGAPIVVEDATLEDEWRPEDYSRKFFGPTRLRKALTLSLNLVSVRLLRAIGPDFAIEHLTHFGFDRKQLPRNLSLALGTASVTPLQMASAFAVFANGGYKVTPYFIARVEDGNHNVLEQARPAVVCPQCPATETPVIPAAHTNPDEKALHPVAPRVISPENVFIMTSMMKDVIAFGTGQMAMELGRKDLAGKTGTTNEHRDAWFSGFNTDVVTTAWVGFDQPAPLGAGEVGGRAALPIWIEYMRTALQGMPEKPLIPPPDIVTATINRETGKVTEPSDPEAMEEYFVEGTVPGQVNAKDGTVTQQPTQPENIREGLF